MEELFVWVRSFEMGEELFVFEFGVGEEVVVSRFGFCEEGVLVWEFLPADTAYADAEYVLPLPVDLQTIAFSTFALYVALAVAVFAFECTAFDLGVLSSL